MLEKFEDSLLEGNMANRLLRIEKRLESLETVVGRENNLHTCRKTVSCLDSLDFQNTTYNIQRCFGAVKIDWHFTNSKPNKE